MSFQNRRKQQPFTFLCFVIAARDFRYLRHISTQI